VGGRPTGETALEEKPRMAICKTIPLMFSNLTWKDVERLIENERFVVILPLGSTEPHGPHCPLSTDLIISLEASLRAAQKLHNILWEAYVLPPLPYTVCEVARHFPGNVAISRETALRLMVEIGMSLITQGIRNVAIFNSHFEPGHISAIYDAVEEVKKRTGVKLVFTDVTKTKFAARLTEAFQKASTHADRYETSLVMAVDRGLVNEERRKRLKCLPINMKEKLFQEKARSFEDMGMTEAYCGDPASASIGEGEETFDLLSDFIVEDIERSFPGDGKKAR